MSLFFYELPNNTSQAANIPIAFTEVPLAAISNYLGTGEAVSLYATIGWQASGRVSRTRIRFTVWRDAPFTGTQVCSFIDSCEANFDKYKVSNVAHVDTGFKTNQNNTYVLTAQLLDPDTAASVIGGLTFLATTNQQG
jgi:hypothetical protein